MLGYVSETKCIIFDRDPVNQCMNTAYTTPLIAYLNVQFTK